MKNALAIFAILSNGVMATSDAAALAFVEEIVAKENRVDELTPETSTARSAAITNYIVTRSLLI